MLEYLMFFPDQGSKTSKAKIDQENKEKIAQQKLTHSLERSELREEQKNRSNEELKKNSPWI